MAVDFSEHGVVGPAEDGLAGDLRNAQVGGQAGGGMAEVMDADGRDSGLLADALAGFPQTFLAARHDLALRACGLCFLHRFDQLRDNQLDVPDAIFVLRAGLHDPVAGTRPGSRLFCLRWPE